MGVDLGQRCLRLLFEPMEQSVEEALTNVAAMEAVTREVPHDVPRLLHGCERTVWPLLQEARRRGYQGRIGFEDTLVGPNGEQALSNAELVTAAVDLLVATDGHVRGLDDR